MTDEQELLSLFRKLIAKALLAKNDVSSVTADLSQFLNVDICANNTQSSIIAALAALVEVLQGLIKSIEGNNSVDSVTASVPTSLPSGGSAADKAVAINKKQVVPDANAECQKSLQLPPVDPQYVQLLGDKAAIDEKIAKFIALKQMDNNMANVQEFCGAPYTACMADTFAGDGCARTRAAFQPRAGNRHVIVKRVVNRSGPQMTGHMPMVVQSTSQQSVTPTVSSHSVAETDNSLPASVGERLTNMESHLKLYSGRPVPNDIYERLQCLENRILFLESSSPEYFDKVPSKHHKRKHVKMEPMDSKPVFSTAYSESLAMGEIDSRINLLKQTLAQRAQTTS